MSMPLRKNKNSFIPSIQFFVGRRTFADSTMLL